MQTFSEPIVLSRESPVALPPLTATVWAHSQSPATVTTLLPPPLPQTPIHFIPPTSSPGPEIDPLLTTPECGGGILPVLSPSNTASTSEADPQDMTTDQLSLTPTRLRPKYVRTRATLARPLFGHVKGVYRGNDPHSTLLDSSRSTVGIKLVF